MEINLFNAFGFIGAGLLMVALHYLPNVTGVRELWLIVMSGVLIAIGLLVIARAVWLRIAPRLLVLSQALAPERDDAGVRDVSHAARRIGI
jgi:sulfite exporter TauE/SafE